MKGSLGTVYPVRRTSAAELAILGAIWLLVAAGFLVFMLAAPIAATLVAIADHSLGIVGAALMIAMTVTLPISLATVGCARLSEAVSLAVEARHTVEIQPVLAEAEAEAPPRSARADGYAVPEVAIGRFGAAVFRQIPGDAAVRRFGDHFEFQVDGQWIPFDTPGWRTGDPAALQIAPEPAESEFVAKVYAAVVTTSGDEVDRPGCAILRPDQILPFLAGLPLRGVGELDDSLSELVA
jgi:hypothetical protein